MLADDLSEEISSYEQGVDMRPILTIADLEAFIVVKERVKESKEFLGYTHESLGSNETNLNATAYLLAYTRERLNSAYAWSEFFGLSGREFKFDNASLASSCAVKIAEAEERVQFVKLLLPDFFKDKDLGQAYAHQKAENYALCLFTASKVKAEVDVVLSASGVESSKIHELMGSKLLAVRRNIVRQMEKDIFPILGYSYYEYGRSLQESDPYSALLYLEYALELSNIDLYFKQDVSTWTAFWRRIDTLRLALATISLVLGIFIGVLCTLTVQRGFLGTHTNQHRKGQSRRRQERRF